MLNLFREKKTQQIVLGAILFLVCAAMVITLIPGLGGDEGRESALRNSMFSKVFSR